MADAPAPAATPPTDPDAYFNSLYGNSGGTPQAPTPGPQAPAPAAAAPSQSDSSVSIQPAYPSPTPQQSPFGDLSGVLQPPDQNQPGVQDTTSALDAAVGGAAKGAFAAEKTLLGPLTPEADQQGSAAVDKATDSLTQDSLGNSLVAGISQFGIGMLGVGKLAMAAKALPLAGDGLEAASTFLGSTASESLKAALAGSVFFDPHSGNIANWVQTIPGLKNPVTQALSDQSGDSDALGRVKNALTSIGVDGLVQGTLVAGLGVLRAIRGGNSAAIGAAHENLTQAVQAEQDGREDTNAGLTAAHQDQPEEEQSLSPSQSPSAPSPGGGSSQLDSASPSYGQSQAPSGSPAEKLNDTGIPKDETLTENPRVVQSPTQGAAPGALPNSPKLLNLSDDQVASLVTHARDDSQALIDHGSWEGAINAGHTFGDATHIPWQKLSNAGSPTTAIDGMIARVAETLKEEMDKAKGGDVVGDVANDKMVQARARLWGEDPAALIGLLQTAGKNATQLRANMDASYLIAQRAMQDAYTLSERINAGYFEEFGGSREAALTAFQQTVAVASTAYSQGNAMRANVGRAMRGLRGQFAPTPSDLAVWKSVDPEMLLGVIQGTKGDPQSLTKALSPKLWEPGGLGHWAAKFGEVAQWLLINNLVSNPVTHAVILATNGYQVATRPFERLMGSGLRAIGQSAGWMGKDADAGVSNSSIAMSAGKQYRYMASSILDSFQTAVKAFKAGDSIIAPHTVETGAANTAMGQTIAQADYKPFDSVPHTLYNALTFIGKTLGLPTRFVGMQDELVKNIVYRSKVLANAEVAGINMGLKGDALSQHISSAVSNAFDEAGHATDTEALNEARIATFQQDLSVRTTFGNLGKTLQNARSQVPPVGMVLPFVPTPVNLFRNGIKLTPVLNMAQADFRDAITGALGPEQQTQALGQMAMGSLVMSTIAFLAHEGRVTGGGPSDPKIKQQLLNTGWRPYSFAIPNKDGTTSYFQYGRFDPVAMPLGIMADAMDAAHHDDPVLESKQRGIVEALMTGLLKSMTDKLYLSNLSALIDSIDDPDRSLWKTTGQMASNYVPMSALVRAANPDPVMREARSFADEMMKGIPGLSEKVAAKRDFAGEPVSIHKGVFLTDNGSVVDHEVQRLGLEQGLSLGPPETTAHGGVDLRQLTMMDGTNAYDKYQSLSAQPAPGMPRLKDELAKLIKSDAYQSAPDGAGNDDGTKMNMLMDTISDYRQAALAKVSADPNVSKAMYARERATAAAYAAKRANPTPKNQQSEMLDKLGQSFGVDLHAMAGGTGVAAPSPLSGSTIPQQ